MFSHERLFVLACLLPFGIAYEMFILARCLCPAKSLRRILTVALISCAALAVGTGVLLTFTWDTPRAAGIAIYLSGMILVIAICTLGYILRIKAMSFKNKLLACCGLIDSVALVSLHFALTVPDDRSMRMIASVASMAATVLAVMYMIESFDSYMITRRLKVRARA